MTATRRCPVAQRLVSFRSMGIWGRLRSSSGIRSAEHTRNAMRKAYHDSLHRSQREGVPLSADSLAKGTGPPEHVYGLFDALASRYWAAGVPRKEIERRAGSVFAELGPFFYLDRQDGIEALAEYVVWKEASEAPQTAGEVRLEWLREKIREGVMRAEEIDPSGWVSVVREHRSGPSWIRWMELVE